MATEDAPLPPIVHTLRVHAMTYTDSLMTIIERAILDERISIRGCAPIITCQAFPYTCEQPRDMWADTPHTRGYRDRVITEARKLGIAIEFYS